MEPVRSNLLETAVPAGFSGLTLSAETNVTDVDIDDVHMQSIRLKSGAGSLRVRGVYTKYLSVGSDSGSVFCLLPLTFIFPRCSSTIHSAIDRPMPKPLRSRALSAR